MTATRWLVIALLGWIVPFAGPAADPPPSAAPTTKVEYNRHVRPILAENCFACHGPDSAARKADLRLDIREQAIDAGAVVPGRPDKSSAIERILSTEPSEVMPPPKSHKTLTAAQKDTLKRWVTQGAEYQPHWSLIAPTRPALPAVKNAAWVRTPIDAFILAGLEARGLTPAPEADRRTLARRLSLDLTGLPPTPADVDAFVADPSADYYEKFVAKLMATPAWGEHRGRYWLDAARYADTHGIHFDNYREMWSYRDWVINAFNRNLPFDQFTTEQLAGDLLPHPTLDQLVATGFNRCNITTNEGGIIDEEYAVLYARDRTETVSQVWMGLTAGCAVCHDHKFDPLSQKEFYALSSIFNNFNQPVRDGNIPNPAPTITVPRAEDRPRFEALSRELEAARKAVADRKTAARSEFAAWLKTVDPKEIAGQVPTAGMVLFAKLSEGKGRQATATVDGQSRNLTLPEGGYAWVPAKTERIGLQIQQSGPAVSLPDVGDFDTRQPYSVAAWVRNGKRNQTGAVLARMDEGNSHRGWDVWLEGDRIGAHLINAWPQDALKVVSTTPLQFNKWQHVAVSYDGSGKAAGMKVYIDGQLQTTTVQADALKSTTRTKVPLKVGQRNSGARVANVGLSDLRVYDRALSGLDAQALAGNARTAELLAKPADKRTPKEADDLFAWWIGNKDAESQRLATKARALESEEAALRARGTIAHVASEKPQMPEAFVLFRGEYDQRRDKVGPATPKALPPMPPDLPRNRLGLAKWLLRPEHPLTARVTVNRFWQQLYGTGLVRTSGDFGTTGELPSHPELLDWMAVEFRENGWDIKKFFTLLVTSAAYRQAAVATPEKLEKDADNRLMSRGSRFRMDAEMVRDYALAASGLLSGKIGGPSVKPYQPPGVWEAVAMIGSNTRDYKRDSGESLYRRSMYTFWKRSAPPASMEIFNAPNRETCAVRRERTNTPLQALVTLNDPQFVEAARQLAAVCLTTGGATFDTRLDAMAKRLLARSLTAAEVAVVKDVYTELHAGYKAKPAEAAKLIAVGESKPDPKLDPVDLAAWTMVANQLMNLDEVLNK